MLIPKNLLNVARIADDDFGTRKKLGGVHLKTIDGAPAMRARIEATDGKILIRSEFSPWSESEFPVPPGETPAPADAPEAPIDVIIPAEAAVIAQGLPPKATKHGKEILQEVRVRANGEGTVHFMATDLGGFRSHSERAIDGTFVKMDAALDYTGKTDPIAFNLVRLKELIDALLKVHPPGTDKGNERNGHPLRLASLGFGTGGTLHVVVTDGTTQTHAVAMPMRAT